MNNFTHNHELDIIAKPSEITKPSASTAMKVKAVCDGDTTVIPGVLRALQLSGMYPRSLPNKLAQSIKHYKTWKNSQGSTGEYAFSIKLILL